MEDWKPITISELNELIQRAEVELKGELFSFWKSIKIKPTKWRESEYGDTGGGFWIVAIAENQVIWYNDIEEGFNISEYVTLELIESYSCEQDGLNLAVMKLFNLRFIDGDFIK